MARQNVETRRLESEAGIAIGPILFIIAILAILAAAIAAGSGSFTSGTSTETNRTKSYALIQIGENLKVGMDNITMNNGISPSSVDINALNTSASNALFAPAGGGVASPSVGMANNPLIDKWYYPSGQINGLGTSTGSIIAVLPVSAGVCAEINNRSIGNATVPTTAALGNFASGTVSGATTWPSMLVGVTTGCVQNSSVTVGTAAPPTSADFYYQVLAIQ